MTSYQIATWAFALAAATAACALPQLPEGMASADYYGGFFPTDEWADALATVPRDQRTNPFQEIVIVAEAPHGKEAWKRPQVRLTRQQLDEMAADVASYLRVEPGGFLGMVPRRNRIAGNARVMPATRMVRCPTGDAGLLEWTPDRPDELRCERGHVVDVFSIFPPTGVFEITGPKGDKQQYPYHDKPEGTRIFLNGEYLDSQRTYHLTDSAHKLAQLYRATGQEQYGTRAAAILYDFACAVPHWPKIHRGRPGVEGRDRFRPVDDYSVYTGIWYDKYHSGIGSLPATLALAYDLIVSADVWDEIDATAGGDARRVIEEDLFLYTARDAVRYDVRHPKPSSSLSNYMPYLIRGFICIGRAAAIPEMVHYAYWKQSQLVEKTLMADATFPESPSYARQHIYGMAQGCLLATGYNDPPGFFSTIDARHFTDLDMWQAIPQLSNAITTLETMVYPDNSYIMVHDTWSKLVSSGHLAPVQTRPLIYPSFAHAALARGYREGGNQIQAHLHYSGCWGHDHRDMLGMILWAYKDELVSDIGYAHTYRQFSDWSLGHNLVVVDRHSQKRGPYQGNLLGWHVPEDAVQVVEAADTQVYPQCERYRRALYLVPLGEHDNVVVDIFDVVGGGIHEWMAQGSAMTPQALEVSIAREPLAGTYADDGMPFTPPPAAEYVKQRIAEGKHPHHLEPGEPDPWYGVFRDLQKGVANGPFVATFITDDDSLPPLRLHMLQPLSADVYTCTVPSLRRCWNIAKGGEDHSLVEKYRMPKLIVRRDGENLHTRFVAVWEPTHNEQVVEAIADLAPGDDNLVALRIQATEMTGVSNARVFYAREASAKCTASDGTQLQGRYAAITEAGDHTDIALYDCTYFASGDLEIVVEKRPALSLMEVVLLGGDKHALRLNGTWDDIPEAHSIRFADPEMVAVNIGDHQRVCPVTEVETAGGKTLLHCPRHPGFEWDEEKQQARALFSPYLTISGPATATLPSRLWLRRDGDGPWQVRCTDTVTINGERVEATTEWVRVGEG